MNDVELKLSSTKKKEFNQVLTRYIKNDIQVNIYTINSQPKLDLCIHLNVDGIFTDNHNFYKK